ncbi:hypothetical protein IU450_28065 [Nocardia abscessus]|uniref:hypothetical protein n=1 Tax=Nocardia abscessus TaxID=120957 RepID=UPI0018930F86|nr:hypothetical protein [Nocardia abscessus]MBF6339718.1 hypothetical protein [Nocardia abscessus]
MTALLFYFGWAHVYWFFDYFGVDSTTLHPSLSDYLMRSVDALFIPLIAIGVIGMALTWGYLALPDSLRRGHRKRWQLLTITAVAVIILVNGLTRLLFKTPLNNALAVAPISIIAGVALLWYVVLQRRQQLRERIPEQPVASDAAAVIEWTILFIVIGISLFWITADYSAAVGQSRAQLTAAEIHKKPGVVVYSEKDLYLSDPDVRKVECAPAEGSAYSFRSAYRFRYDGLVLLAHIGDQYVLLPRSWPTQRGAAIILPASPPGAVRFEFRIAENSAGSNCT